MTQTEDILMFYNLFYALLTILFMLTVPSPPDHFTSKHVSESTECSSGC